MTDEKERYLDSLEARIEILEEMIVNLRQALHPSKRYKDHFQKTLTDIYAESNSTHD